MPAVQTSYDQRHGEGRLGAIADGRHVNARSMTNDSGADVGFGIAVGFTGQGTVSPGLNTAFAGIVIASQVQDAALGTIGATAASIEAFAADETIGCMTEGAIWVRPTVTVAAGDPVHFDNATGAISNTGGTQIVGAIFETDAAAGELARAYLK